MGAIIKPIGLYLHFPFCIKKCSYCDFVSYPIINSEPRFDVYIDALIEELKLYLTCNSYSIDTIYIGGGTPSLLSAAQLEKILSNIYKHASISKHCEISIESNPETITITKLNEYYSIGINRISLGIQSCIDSELKTLGRIYNNEVAINAARLIAKSNFHNFNFDLMYGIPTQTFASLKSTLRQIMQFHPTHISAYELTLNNSTRLDRLVKNNILRLPSTNKILRMQEIILEKLQDNSLTRYEVSSYCKNGYQCQHNLHYWNNEEYIACGIAASGYLNNQRYTNTENCKEYTKKLEYQQKPITQIETLTESQLNTERIMLSLRLVNPLTKEIIKKMLARGLSKYINKNGCLNFNGFAALNHITTELI